MQTTVAFAIVISWISFRLNFGGVSGLPWGQAELPAAQIADSDEYIATPCNTPDCPIRVAHVNGNGTAATYAVIGILAVIVVVSVLVIGLGYQRYQRRITTLENEKVVLAQTLPAEQTRGLQTSQNVDNLSNARELDAQSGFTISSGSDAEGSVGNSGGVNDQPPYVEQKHGARLAAGETRSGRQSGGRSTKSTAAKWSMLMIKNIHTRVGDKLGAAKQLLKELRSTADSTAKRTPPKHQEVSENASIVTGAGGDPRTTAAKEDEVPTFEVLSDVLSYHLKKLREDGGHGSPIAEGGASETSLPKLETREKIHTVSKGSSVDESVDVSTAIGLSEGDSASRSEHGAKELRQVAGRSRLFSPLAVDQVPQGAAPTREISATGAEDKEVVSNGRHLSADNEYDSWKTDSISYLKSCSPCQLLHFIGDATDDTQADSTTVNTISSDFESTQASTDVTLSYRDRESEHGSNQTDSDHGDANLSRASPTSEHDAFCQAQLPTGGAAYCYSTQSPLSSPENEADLIESDESWCTTTTSFSPVFVNSDSSLKPETIASHSKGSANCSRIISGRSAPGTEAKFSEFQSDSSSDPCSSFATRPNENQVLTLESDETDTSSAQSTVPDKSKMRDMPASVLSGSSPSGTEAAANNIDFGAAEDTVRKFRYNSHTGIPSDKNHQRLVVESCQYSRLNYDTGNDIVQYNSTRRSRPVMVTRATDQYIGNVSRSTVLKGVVDTSIDQYSERDGRQGSLAPSLHSSSKKLQPKPQPPTLIFRDRDLAPGAPSVRSPAETGACGTSQVNATGEALPYDDYFSTQNRLASDANLVCQDPFKYRALPKAGHNISHSVCKGQPGAVGNQEQERQPSCSYNEEDLRTIAVKEHPVRTQAVETEAFQSRFYHTVRGPSTGDSPAIHRVRKLVSRGREAASSGTEITIPVLFGTTEPTRGDDQQKLVPPSRETKWGPKDRRRKEKHGFGRDEMFPDDHTQCQISYLGYFPSDSE